MLAPVWPRVHTALFAAQRVPSLPRLAALVTALLAVGLAMSSVTCTGRPIADKRSARVPMERSAQLFLPHGRGLFVAEDGVFVVPLGDRGETAFELEPRIELADGAWSFRDVLGTERLELSAGASTGEALLAAEDWVTDICEAGGRPLHLVGFEGQPALRDALLERIANTCPSITAYRVRAQHVFRCGLASEAFARHQRGPAW